MKRSLNNRQINQSMNIRVYGIRTAHFQSIFIKIGIISVRLTFFEGIISVRLRHLKRTQIIRCDYLFFLCLRKL